ncbi:MAG: 4-hydroxythreonine-4-phosphate dehydrogenase PdxA [Methylophilaceae bacterium]|jgi:4-hydroxythreonine-4-phosphate dehydrogenase|nr:4-hydroxythreonine-4-phosphate dehydrogenase PdxA [Methylophilaceae bacterium]
MCIKLPSIIINSGEPAGIGLDLCVFLAFKKFPAKITIMGNKEALIRRAKLHKKKIHFTKNLGLHKGNGDIHLINVPYHSEVVAGKPNQKNSMLQLKMIDYGVSNCLNKNYDALVTLPISKEVLSSNKLKFTGHTEYISNLCKTSDKEVMLLANQKLRIALVTTHVALSKVSRLITKTKLTNVIKTLHFDLQKRFKIKKPKIIITGLNPHAGENGNFGSEEIKVILPVIDSLNNQGFNLIGPVPADTAFVPKNIKDVDCFLAMFHDQGLSAFKALSFGQGVNITLGLPIIRTSVDHGTAFSLVGTNDIDPKSFYQAIDMAINLEK